MCITSKINHDIENDTGEIVLRTYSLGLTYMTRNDGYGALISHTFSNIKSLKIMKSKKNPKKTKSNFRVKIWRKNGKMNFLSLKKL